MKQISLILVFSILLLSCSRFGTRTLYKSSSYASINGQRIGFLELRCEAVLSKIYPNTNIVFRHTIDSTLHLYNKFQVRYLSEHFCTKPPTANEIKELCRLNNIDAVFYSTLKFTEVFPYGYLDSSVLMELYDKDGSLIIKSKHNTSIGNSYWKFPKPDRTIKDATYGALNRILSEMKIEKIKSKR